MHKFRQRAYLTQHFSFLLGICTQKNRRDYLTTFLARLVERKNINRTNFALTSAPLAIRVSLIEGLSAGRTDLQQKTSCSVSK